MSSSFSSIKGREITQFSHQASPKFKPSIPFKTLGGEKMAAKMRVLVMIAMVASLIHVSYAATGTATYYTPPYVPSSCYGYQNNGVMIAAASNTIWGNRAACGRNYKVTCTGPTNAGVQRPCRGSVVVKIVDYCPPPGCRATIDLSQEAFAIIADPNAGKVNIEYHQV